MGAPGGRGAPLGQSPLHAVPGVEVAVDDLPFQHVHGRRADEARDEDVGRAVVEVERRPRLLDHATVHDHDLVGHRHGLDLIVGDVDGRHLEPLVQRLDLGAHLHAQLGVEIGERLVEQEYLRDCARWRGPWRRAGAGRPKAGADSGAGAVRGRGSVRPAAPPAP